MSTNARFGFLLLLTLSIAIVWLAPTGWTKPKQSEPSLDRVSVQLAGETFQLEVARSNADRERGLMGRKRLEKNGGMLFIFPDAPKRRAFWMRGCLIPLDILFFHKGRLTTVYDQVAPCRAPKPTDCPVYMSQGPSDRVIELPAGTAHRLDLRSGLYVPNLP
jgi:uncharacterized membrane protein (UPF0127 family)